MLKYIALLFNTVALLIYQFFFADGVTISQNVPSSAKPETEFTVEITINKGSTGGFAKLQQDLPEGFTAVQDDNNGASFTFSNQSVKFIWMALPADKEFKVKYKIKVGAGVSGDKILAGKFSYVVDNVKQSIDIAPSTIKIDGPQAAATNTSTNTNTTTDNTATNTNTASNTTSTNTSGTSTNNSATTGTPGSLTCTRNAPANAKDEFTVELNVNKGNLTGFAKLLETLPAGFTATAIESQGGAFSFTDGKVKYVWVSMPTQPEFKLSYKVTVAAGTNGNQTIDGVFSYIENDETKKCIIPSSSIMIGEAAVASNTNTTNTTTDNTANTNTTTATNTNTASNTTTDNTAATNNTTNSTTNNTSTDNTTNTNNTAASNTTNTNATNMAATTIPPVQGNVNYKVQIAALRNPVNADKLATRYGINQPINLEMAEGFTKYTVGGHAEYKQARDAREEIKSKGVSDAFVTAYNSGKRITVQEALMISSQKWFR